MDSTDKLKGQWRWNSMNFRLENVIWSLWLEQTENWEQFLGIKKMKVMEGGKKEALPIAVGQPSFFPKKIQA